MKNFIALIFLTIIGIGINGYFFGEFAQSQLLVFQESLSDSTLYHNDLMLMLRPYFYTYFFLMLSLPSSIFGLQNVYFFLYVLSMYFFYAAIFFLSKAIFKDTNAAYLSVVLLLINKPSIAVETIFPTLFPRTLVFPILLFAIYFFIIGRYKTSFILVGLSMNLHMTSALHVFLMLGFYLLVSLRRIGVVKCFGYAALTFAFGMPVLIWSSLYPSVGFFPPQIWWDIVHLKFLHHLATFSWSPFLWVRGGSFILAFLLALKQKPEKEIHAKIMAMVLAIVIMSVSGTFFYYLIPVPVLVTLTLWISWKFFTVFAMIYAANHIIQIYNKELGHKIAITGFASSLFLSNFKAVLLFALALIALHFRDSSRKKKLLFYVPMIVFFILSCLSILGSITTNIPYVYAFKVGFLPLLIILVSIFLMLIYEFFKEHLKWQYQKTAAVAFVFAILALTLGGVLLLRKQLEYRQGAIYENMMESYEYDAKRLPPVSTFSEIAAKPYNFAQNQNVRPITFSLIKSMLKNPIDYFRHNVDIPNSLEVNEWRKVQIWINQNTGKNDIIVSPPNLKDFRSFSERAIVGEFEDISMVNYNIGIGLKIFGRVKDVCGSKLIGECVENACIDLCRRNYEKLTEKDFMRIANKYNASYIIVQNPKYLNFSLAYENREFRAYKT